MLCCQDHTEIEWVVLDTKWSNLFVLSQFQLQLLYLLLQESNGPRWFILIYGDPVLDISCPVCIFKSIQSLHKITVTWWHTSYHYCLAVTCKELKVLSLGITLFTRPVSKGFVVDKVAPKQVCPWTLQSYPVCNAPPDLTFTFHSSVMNARHPKQLITTVSNTDALCRMHLHIPTYSRQTKRQIKKRIAKKYSYLQVSPAAVL